MKKTYAFVVFLTTSVGLWAQEAALIDSIVTLETPWLHKNAIGVNAGVTGFGVEYARNLNAHLNVRGRINTFSYKNYQTTFEIDDQKVNATFDIKMLTTDLLLEYLPSKKSSFKLVGGFSYLANYNINGILEYEGTLEYGDLTLDKEQIGNIVMDVDWSGSLAPYLGFGFGRAVPKKRVGFGIEAGSYYAKAPSASISGNKMLEPMEEESEQFQENLSDYRWLPNIKLNLTVRF